MNTWNPTAEDPPSEDMLELAANYFPASVLDVGCGTGRNLMPFNRPGCRLVGIDSDIEAVTASKARFRDHAAGSVSIRLDDLRTYRPDRTFDLLLCYGVLHFLTFAERASAYRAFKSWVAADGLMSLVMFNAALPIPDDLRLLMPEPAADSSELLNEFADWRIVKHRSYVYDDTHDSDSVRHTHSIDRLLVKNSSGTGAL